MRGPSQRYPHQNGHGAPRCLLARLAPAFAAFFVLTTALQWYKGAFHGEFGGHPDEASHVVTGLMVRDYIAALAPEAPMRYAENYYLHYPKVALGHWPPLFYIVEAAWMLLFPPSRVSLLLLMGLFTATLATMLYEVLRREFSVPAGMAAAVLLISLPVVQLYSRRVMMEIPLAVLFYIAVLVYGRYLDNPRWQDAAWFGLVASLACLTNGSGFLLALVPVFSVLLTWRFRLLGRFSFWLPALIVLPATAPWYLFAPSALRQATGAPGKPYLLAPDFRSVLDIVPGILYCLGLGLVPFLIAGLYTHFAGRTGNRTGRKGKWVVGAALILALGVFRAIAPEIRDSRHVTCLAAPMLMFVVAGVSWLCAGRILRRLHSRWRTAAVGLAVAAIAAGNVYQTPKVARRGFAEVARDITSAPRFQRLVCLVSSDSRGEGMMVVEMALHEKRPGHIVLRGSKMLADSDWMGTSYRLRYPTPEAMMNYLHSVPVGVLVMEDTPGRKLPHHQLLEEALRRYPSQWELVGAYPPPQPGGPDDGRIRVYHLLGSEAGSPPKVRIDMRSRLGRFLEN